MDDDCVWSAVVQRYGKKDSFAIRIPVSIARAKFLRAGDSVRVELLGIVRDDSSGHF